MVTLVDHGAEDTFAFFPIEGSLYGIGVKGTIYKVIDASYGYAAEKLEQLPSGSYSSAVSFGSTIVCEREFWSPREGNFFTWSQAKGSPVLSTASGDRLMMMSLEDGKPLSHLFASRGDGTVELIGEFSSRYSFISGSDYMSDYRIGMRSLICKFDNGHVNEIAELPDRDSELINIFYCGEVFLVYSDSLVLSVDSCGMVSQKEMVAYLPFHSGGYRILTCGRATSESAYFCFKGIESNSVFLVHLDLLGDKVKVFGPMSSSLGSFSDFCFTKDYFFTVVDHRVVAYDRVTGSMEWAAKYQSRYYKYFTVVSEKEILVTGRSSGAHLAHIKIS